MPVPRRRHSRGRQDRRRTHERLFATQLVACGNPECGAPKPPHRVCPKCGQYRGRSYKTIVTQ
jgi:large subunit ribosomal protein L32